MVSLKKNPYKSPKIRIFEKIRTKIRICTDKSVRVGTLAVPHVQHTSAHATNVS